MNRQTDHANIPSTYEKTSDLTPNLATLDDAETLMKIEWNKNESDEGIPRQYSTPYGHLTTNQPRQHYMRMDSNLNVTPEGSLNEHDNLTTLRGDVGLTET